MIDFLTSDYAILLTVLLIGGFLIRPHRWVVRRMWTDDLPWARITSRIALSTIGLFLVWTTVFDNWRKMLGLLVDEKNRWKSDLYRTEPPADAVRMVTIALFFLSVLGASYLYARYARGYFIPIIVAPIGLIVFYALNGFRMRFDVVGALWQGGVDWTKIEEVIPTLTWFGVDQSILFVLILSAFAVFWGPTAIIFSLIFRRTIGRETVDEPAMYRVLSERRVAREGHDANA
ncbi:MAG TPA: hypothetical protein VEX37_16245 [Thermomicrobiales bacterium]|nr:hypothetical protein [Thermomicrobiales bacterium]